MFSKAKSEGTTTSPSDLSGDKSADSAKLDKTSKKQVAGKKDGGSRNVAPTQPPSIISTNMTVQGDLMCDGEIQVDGIIKGDVRCEKLTVGQEGTIEGSVLADRVLLRGKVSGQIEAKAVTLMSTATVIGDIVHDALTIEPGAFMEGHCKRREKVTTGTAKMDLVSSNEGELATA